MTKLDELLKKNQATDAKKANDDLQKALNEPSTHRDGEVAGGIDKDKITEVGRDVIVKDTVVTDGNKDNRVTAAVVNEAANSAPHSILAPPDAHMERVQNAAGAAMLAGAEETVAPDGTRMESSMQPRIVAEAEPSSAARTSNIVTGMEVGQPLSPMHSSPIAGVLATEPLSPEVEENLRAKSLGVYEPTSNGLTRYFRKDGTAQVPEKGLYYAKDAEDVEHLEHFAKSGHVTKR